MTFLDFNDLFHVIIGEGLILLWGEKKIRWKGNSDGGTGF